MGVMKTKDEPLIGYFIPDVVPTEAQLADANTYLGRVVFRNANYVEIVEKDIKALAGDIIPAPYAHLPRAKRRILPEGEVSQNVAAVAPKGAAVKA